MFERVHPQQRKHTDWLQSSYSDALLFLTLWSREDIAQRHPARDKEVSEGVLPVS